MKKIYQTYPWIVFVFLTFIYSCTNDIDDRVHFLKQIDEVSVDSSVASTIINYDGNKIVSIDSDTKRSNFYYTGSLITKTEELDKQSNHVNTLEYAYSDFNLVKITSSDHYVMNYIHNADGTVSYEKLIKDSNNNDIKEFHGIMYFKNNNLVKDEKTLDGNDANVITKNTNTYSYDYKNNAFYNILGFNKLLNFNKLISFNNSLNCIEASEIKYINTNQVTSSIKLYKNDYKYDLAAYPKEIVSEKLFLGNENSQHFKTVLYYD
jgi:hypothetical protein